MPDRQLSAGVLQPIKAGSEYNSPLQDEITTPQRELVSGMPDVAWYKDKDTMEDLGARLSQAFGGLTMRGNSAAETAANMKRMQAAAANKQKNKTMDYLIKNNPEMAKTLLSLPEQYRGKAMETMLGMGSGEESAFAEKVRMLQETGVPRADAISQVLSGSGTNINMNMGGGAKPFETKLGEQAAEWYGSRQVTSRENRREANRVIGDLQNAIKNGQPITGSWASYLPETLRNVVDAEGLDMQQSVERIVQQSLKETLGAQFAQKEAEQLFARTWNPKASPEVNLRRTQRLLGELDAYAANMDHITQGMLESDGSILKWLRENPSEYGPVSASSIYDIEYEDDFDTAGVTSQQSGSGSSTPPAGIDPAVWAEMSDEQRALFDGL